MLNSGFFQQTASPSEAKTPIKFAILILITSNLFSAFYSFKLEERVVTFSEKCDNWLVVSNFTVGIVIAVFLALLKALVQTMSLSIPKQFFC